MSEITEVLNFLLALLGIVLVLSVGYLVFDLYTKRLLKQHVQNHGLLLVFLLTLGGGVVTFFYSEVLGFIPCGLCWMQRVFLYPQIFITGTALWIKDKTVPVYGIVLSISGVLIALYQHYLQVGGSELVGCPAASVGADCTERIMFEFGFMTFPLLSAIMFTFLVSLYWYIYKTR